MLAREAQRVFERLENFSCLGGKGRVTAIARQPHDELFLTFYAALRLGHMPSRLRNGGLPPASFAEVVPDIPTPPPLQPVSREYPIR